MMPLVCNVEQVAAFNPAMIRLGYEPRGEYGVPGRRYYIKGGDEDRSHHVHTFQQDHLEVARHLDFRDYLIAHPAEARQYAALKVGLARQFLHAIEDYMAGKDAFIKKTIEKARAWRANQSNGSVADFS